MIRSKETDSADDVEREFVLKPIDWEALEAGTLSGEELDEQIDSIRGAFASMGVERVEKIIDAVRKAGEQSDDKEIVTQ